MLSSKLSVYLNATPGRLCQKVTTHALRGQGKIHPSDGQHSLLDKGFWTDLFQTPQMRDFE